MSESENIDLSNNLCVAEAAFEEFQVGSNYEEDEFITLSDIVDPPRPTLDINACLDEIQDDVCIISVPNPQTDQNNASDSTAERNQEPLVSLPASCDGESNAVSSNSIQTVQDVSKALPQPTLKKRGRKKKNSIPSMDMTEQFNKSSESVTPIDQRMSSEKEPEDGVDNILSDKTVCDRLSQSSSKEVENSTRHSTRRRRKRPFDDYIPLNSQSNIIAREETFKRQRGRPKKVNSSSKQHDETLSKHDEEKATWDADKSHTKTVKEDDNLDNSENPDKSSFNMHQSNMSVEDTTQSLDDKTPRKRGRKKKSNNHSEDINRLESNDITNTFSTEVSKQNTSESSSKSVKGKSKKKEQDKKYDDIELELLRMLSTPTEEVEQKVNEIATKGKEKPSKKHRTNRKKEVKEANQYSENPLENEVKQAADKEDTDDETDDICLSSLKKRFKPEDDHNNENSSLITAIDKVDETSDNVTEMLPKCNDKNPITSDLERNVDTVVSESIDENVVEQDVEKMNSPETESPSKRPIRKKAKKVLHYDEGSDEDPFANVELSDDEDNISRRKGGRCYSDDEYIPGKNRKGKKYSESESSLSESDDLMNEEETNAKKMGRKKGRKSAETHKKNQNKNLTQNAVPDVTSTTADTTTQNDEDLEHSLQSPDITTNENINQKPGVWGISHEFENFIAQKIQGTNLKIKKLTGRNSSESTIAPLEIPVIDPTEPKKTSEVSTQTCSTTTKTVEVQTTSPHESIMKCKVPLSSKQSEKACEFLKGIVRNTSELGQLMIQKSEDFIQKKINTKNVTDTNKLDYCVQKSFLLFKLAKHNLIQMEDDLANEYEQFLKSHHMSEFRQTPKCITASSKQTNSDSDCEIVEETTPERVKEKEKSKFNLKTVFLNKELSIKIAKKPSEEPKAKKEKVNIAGGRHTVWINDSVMVKKVKPTQSFLAQDSRNKKPPDTYVSIDMVRKFFESYYNRQKVLLTCAPFVSPGWLNVKQVGICNYFIAQTNDLSTHSSILLTQQNGTEPNIDGMNMDIKENHITQPKSLLAQCTKALNKYMYERRPHYEESLVAENNQDLSLKPKHQPKTLLKLSLNIVSNMLIIKDNKIKRKEMQFQNITSLKKLCLRSVNMYIHEPLSNKSLSDAKRLSKRTGDIRQVQNTRISNENQITNRYNRSDVKSLFSCCIESIQKTNSYLETCDKLDTTVNNNILNTALCENQKTTTNKIQRSAKSLFLCCLDIIQKNNLPAVKDTHLTNINEKRMFNGIKTLKCIAFENVKSHMYDNILNIYNSSNILDQISPSAQNCTANTCCMDKDDQLLALTIKSVNTLSDDIFAKLPDTIDEAPPYLEDDNSNFSNYDDYEPQFAESNQYEDADESNWVSRLQLQELKSCFVPTDNNSKTALIRNSKDESVLASIKIEPLEEVSDNIDESIIKTEIAENDETVFNPLETKLENSDNDAEDNLPEQSSSSYDVDAFEEFARTNKMLQKADYDLANNEVFTQSTFRVRKQHEPDTVDEFDTGMSLLVPQENTDVAKDRLMKSSSDEEINTQKNTGKKRRKVKLKASRLKNKELTIPKNKSTPENEVALLTRRMQGRIRQEEKSEDSSDSEKGDTLAKMKHDKTKKETGEKAKLKMDKEKDIEIQCNDVDSTQNSKVNISNEDKKLNEKKLSKMSLRKKIKGNSFIDNHACTEQDNSFGIQPDDPVELLECEPTLPMMDDDNTENIEPETGGDHIDEKCHEPELQEEPSYIDRHGWKCYPVNNKDTKLYEHAFILLEKLPESFVETYFRYQDVADKDQDDADVDRLTNLQTLHRTFSKDGKTRSKTNRIIANGQQKSNNTENSRASSPVSDDNFNELEPSEDEGADIDSEIPQPLPLNATENVMAKNSLMNDVESDSEKPGMSEAEVGTNKSIKKEKDEEPTSKKYRPGPKSKKDIKENDSTLLTADKMMNKELALLHAPVTLDSQDVKVFDAPKKHSPKIVTKTSSRLRAQQERERVQDESSSEEEKQWVTTKEKLLKRLVKKQGNPGVDDAKRAKIVSEFIEKRGDAPENRGINRSRKRRSRKKFLERKKQMSILNRELFGEPDTSYAGRKHSQTFGKGRRNIRKVIDKKSLARSTVIANMEEFERKRRLNMQQTRLREELGCEEGVNVLVINDEVCLEYDFEQMRPVVTIHPFFTKVMKAHQYEGVKFMWDACFESLAMVASGHPGGGCILAHCMGLGKTLQVLALLHTVLTHPGVGMKRVLVCCPLSTVLNWVDEINKWIGPVTNKIKVFELSKLKKTYERAYQLEDWYKDGGIFIIGYELFRSLSTLDPILDDIKPKIVDKIRHALLNPGPDVVICDEGHLLKNDASVLAVAMSRVATKRRIVLTGTPMQNNLREYYCMVNFVKPNLLGTYAEYSNRFENPIMNGQHRDSQEEDIKLMKARTHILHKVLEGCLQRQEASVLYPYLPKKHEYTVFIPPTKCQWDLYKHYIMTYALEQQDKHQNKKHNLLKDFHVLQKIWTHPQVLHNFLMKARDERNKIKEEKLEDDLAQEDLAASEDMKPTAGEVWWLQYLAGGDMLDSLDSSNKFVVVFQLLEEFVALGDKVLIFSTSLYTMDALEYFLKRMNSWRLGHDYFRLDGSVPAEVRQKWCREFNAPHNLHTKLFLISTRAGCLGLNMTAANRVIILDTSWNPAHDIQSIFRVYRFGQKKDCHIYRLVSMGTMEQKIYERSVTKQAVSCRVVDEQQIDRHYNMAELTELYRYDEEGDSVEAGFAAGVHDVALLRVAARARLHAVREHDSLLRGSREQHLPEHERNAAWMQFQQEHANNEMQDRLLEASQGIQRILDVKCAEQSGLVPVKTETGEPAQLIVPEPGPKGRRYNKKSAANSTPPAEDTNINAQKEMQLDADKEEAKVKKIMQLLIKHKFHMSQHAKQISQLVSNVRAIVDAGGAGLDACDELTRSIATVMLQEEHIPIPISDPPPLTDIATGQVVSSPTLNVKQEEPPESIDDTSEEILDDVPEEITGRVPYQNHLVDGVAPVLVERRPRGRPRKYFHDEVFEPVVKRPRGRPRKNTTDTEQSSIDEDLNTPLQRRSDLGSNESIETNSKRPRGRPRKSYASDADGSVQVLSSKEPSPEMDDTSLLAVASNQKYHKRNLRSVPESDVTIVDDEESRSRDSEAFVVPDAVVVIPEPEVKRPKRAIAVKSTAKSQGVKSNYNGKMKRKAAMAAEQHLESLNSDEVVTLDDDDDWVDDRAKNKLPSPPRGLDTQKNSKSKNDERSKRGDSSIVLLDDDDRPKTNAQQADSTKDTEEVVPLHPSMLSNPNFIKIVAYAYQSNRMLDEDAALLAARYSTQKALKEYESTGKGITSGPLYDIAVKVLTKDVLKKLHNKKGSKRKEASLTSVSSGPPRSQDSALEVTVAGEIPPQNCDVISSDYTSQPNVVPIGMFRGSNMNITSMNEKSHEAAGECILPDDEDCILGTTDEPEPPAPTAFKKRNSQQFVITSVKASGAGEAEPQMMSIETIVPEIANAVMVSGPKSRTKGPVLNVEPHVTITERPQLVLGPNTPTFRLSQSNLRIEPTTPALEQSNLTNNVKPALTLTISEGKLVQTNVIPSSDTICLDSDDEDAAAVNTVPQIVHLAPPQPGASAPSAPTPVAVTTSLPSFSRLNNVQGVKMRINNVQQPPAVVIDAAAPTNASEHVKSQQKKVIIYPPGTNVNQQKSASTPKASPAPPPKLPKPNEALSKKVINPAPNPKPGDLLRITKQGGMSLLSRLDKLPESMKSRLNNVPGFSSDGTKSQQKVADKSKPSMSSATDDPLSILKDVIHIRADEYDGPKLQPANKSSHIEANKQSTTTKSQVQSKDSGSKIKLQYPINVAPENKPKVPVAVKKTNETVAKVKKQEVGLRLKLESNDKKRPTPPATIDLTNLILSNTKLADTKKSRDKSSGKAAVVVGSSKDIIIRTKPTGSTVTKASTSVASLNIKPASIKREFDSKKRMSPWPAPNSPKKKKDRLFRPAQTLEDFDIDDIDDIIELE